MAMKPKIADRAKQFIPFDALKGFRMALRAQEKVTVARKELSEDQKSDLDYQLQQLNRAQLITVTYYDGHQDVRLTGMVSQIDSLRQQLTIVKTVIAFEDLIQLEIPSCNQEE